MHGCSAGPAPRSLRGWGGDHRITTTGGCPGSVPVAEKPQAPPLPLEGAAAHTRAALAPRILKDPSSGQWSLGNQQNWVSIVLVARRGNDCYRCHLQWTLIGATFMGPSPCNQREFLSRILQKHSYRCHLRWTLIGATFMEPSPCNQHGDLAGAIFKRVSPGLARHHAEGGRAPLEADQLQEAARPLRTYNLTNVLIVIIVIQFATHV
eukprot:gene8569-biopygen8199